MIPLKQINQALLIRRFLPWMTAVAVFAVSYPWFIRPIFQSVHASCRQSQVQSLYRERLNRLEQLAAIQRRQRDELMGWKNQHESRLFSAAQADAFFSNLDRTAATLGCQMISAEYETFQWSGQDSKDPISPVFMKGAKLQLTGSYGRWIQWLDWLESLPQCILIDSLKLDSLKDRPGVLSGRINLAIPISAAGLPSENAAAYPAKEK